MGLTVAQRQTRARERRRKRGFVYFQKWVTPEQRASILAFLSGAAYLKPKDALPTITGAKKSKGRKARLTPAEAAALEKSARNHEVIAKHRSKVNAMEREGRKRSEIRIFLEGLGADFGGKTVALNSLLGPRILKNLT